MKKIMMFAAVAAMLALSACGSSEKAAETDNQAAVNVDTPAPEEAEIIDDGVIVLKNDAKFRPDTKVDEVTVLDFNATWCVPCKKLTPAFHQVAKELTDAKFYAVDVDSLPQTAAAFGVETIPMVVILSPDGATQKYTGLTPFVKGAPDDVTDLTPVIAENLKALVIEQKK